jgi:hypothetical protein
MVHGTAAFSWTSSLPMLCFILCPYDLLFLADNPAYLRPVLAIIEKYRSKCKSGELTKKKAILCSQKELLEQKFVNASM